jgi:hypothetical protein
MASPEKKSFLLRIDPQVNAQIEFLLRESLERRGVRARASARPKGGRP